MTLATVEIIRCRFCPEDCVALCDICDKPFCEDHGRKDFYSSATGEVSFCQSCGAEHEPPMDAFDEAYARARARGWSD